MAHFGGDTLRRYTGGGDIHAVAFTQVADPYVRTMKNLMPIVLFCNARVKERLNEVIFEAINVIAQITPN